MIQNKQFAQLSKNLGERGFSVRQVCTKKDALAAIQEIIPNGSKIMNGSSTSLNEIGFTEYLKSGPHQWKNLHIDILKEKDRAIQTTLRRRAIVDVDYFLGSINAVTEDGILVAVDASGSRVGAYPFAANKLILVVGKQKVVKDLDRAFKRIRNQVFPLENARAMKAYGMGSALAKWVIIEREFIPGRITIILVDEELGY